MTTTAQFDTILRHVWTEPRARAEMEWYAENAGPVSQLIDQVGREAAEAYVETGRWPDLVAVVTVTMPPDPPDWEWWEPTTRWRREAARERELDALLKR